MSLYKEVHRRKCKSALDSSYISGTPPSCVYRPPGPENTPDLIILTRQILLSLSKWNRTVSGSFLTNFPVGSTAGYGPNSKGPPVCVPCASKSCKMTQDVPFSRLTSSMSLVVNLKSGRASTILRQAGYSSSRVISQPSGKVYVQSSVNMGLISSISLLLKRFKYNLRKSHFSVPTFLLAVRLALDLLTLTSLSLVEEDWVAADSFDLTLLIPGVVGQDFARFNLRMGMFLKLGRTILIVWDAEMFLVILNISRTSLLECVARKMWQLQKHLFLSIFEALVFVFRSRKGGARLHTGIPWICQNDCYARFCSWWSLFIIQYVL